MARWMTATGKGQEGSYGPYPINQCSPTFLLVRTGGVSEEGGVALHACPLQCTDEVVCMSHRCVCTFPHCFTHAQECLHTCAPTPLLRTAACLKG